MIVSPTRPSSTTSKPIFFFFTHSESSIQSNNLKRESNTTISVSATATLATNNSSIVTGPPPSSVALPLASTSSLSHHHTQHIHHANLMPKYQHHPTVSSENKVDLKTPVVSANKENIPSATSGNVAGVILSDSPNENTEQGIESLANTKEKTPMCLVNELARFNKIQHQYRLIGEQGPAHKKRFTVILKLGEEEYAAEGLSIKKAQHAAAKDAILKTAYKHPPLKTNRQLKGIPVCSKSNSGNITPTVELNALAMKRGEPTVYNVTSTTTPTIMHGMGPIQPNGQYNNQPPSQFNRGGNPYQRRFPNQRGGANFQNRFNGHYGTETFHVTLHVGSRTFSGMGPTQQAARHDAAAR
jgi:double-stranded RNA-binding protein Staufen